MHYHRIRIGRVYNRVFRKRTRLDPYSYADRIVRYANSNAPVIMHIHNAPKFVDQLAGRIKGPGSFSTCTMKKRTGSTAGSTP